MSKIYFSHDALFKTLMADGRVAKEFFMRHLPDEILNIINLNSLSLCQQTYVDEKLKSSHLDVLYEVEMAQEKGSILLLCEHQSTFDSLMSIRLLEYNVAIWKGALKQNRKKKLLPIVNIVFYTGAAKYSDNRDFKDLFETSKNEIEEIWVKPYRLLYLENSPDKELKKYYWSGMMEFFMKNIRKKPFFSYLKEVAPQLQWLKRNDGKHCVDSLLNYVLSNIDVS